MSVKCILTEQGGKGGSGGLALLKIEITTPPTKTTYLSGESFDTTGMVVTAHYGLNNAALTTAEITNYTVSPAVLTDGITKVTISHTDLGRTVTTTQNITVIAKVQSITATTPSVEYEYGDTFPSTYSVTAKYSDNSTKAVTATCTNTNFTSVGNHDVNLSYTENEVTVTTTLTINVKRKKVAKPELKSEYVTSIGQYTGSQYDINNSTYLNNYSSLYYTVTGNSNANAGTYTMTCVPTANYRFDDTISAVNIAWTITKADRIVTISPNNLALNTNNLTKTAISSASAGGGTWSISPSSIAGLSSFSIDSDTGTISITADGSTVINSTTVTVTISGDNNYNDASNTFTISASYYTFDWGDENAVGDETWWNELKTWAANASTSEREACLGKTKKVSLSEPILGASQATMQCIGYDIDGEGTLNFQSKYVLPTTTTFGSSSSWNSSTVKTLCDNFGEKCSATNSIKSIGKKRYSSAYSDYENLAAAKCWLPSGCEMGLQLTDSGSMAIHPNPQEEWSIDGQKIPYQYYTSNSSRCKSKEGNTEFIGYWERGKIVAGNPKPPVTYDVCYIGSDGTKEYTSNYSINLGFAPAFTIGE